ncbi:ATP-binding cassette domain-containing protein [Streptomyces sp. NPDC058476]|uniref:ATP-binding cassette domain-containing protein n=1 Tax=Streptomyces sp. NPDC058476 TaxID=3346519 RepID=UPI00364D8907
MADSKPPALLVQGLSKTYGDGFTAAAGLDLEVPDGAFFGLLGPNGAGKTTLIGSVCNIVRPTTGTLTVFGHDHRSREARRLLGLAEQEINVDRFLSIRQILIYHAGYHGIGRKAAVRRADELLEVFRPDSKAAARDYELSGGMQRRLVLAGAHARSPPAHPRRADRRRRCRAALGDLATRQGPQRGGHHRPADDALPRGGGGVVRRDRAAARRPDRRPWLHGRLRDRYAARDISEVYDRVITGEEVA